MTAPAYPGDAQSRTAADLTDAQALALGRVVTHMTADEAMAIMTRLHVLPMGEVLPDADITALERLAVEQGAREHEAWVELTRWRRAESSVEYDGDEWWDLLRRLRDVADRLGMSS